MFEMLLHINPGLILIAAGILCALSPSHTVRKVLMILAPIAAAVMVFQISNRFGVDDPAYYLRGQITVAGFDLTTLRIDSLSRVWAYIFCLAGLINGIYAFHERSLVADSTALIYTGAAIGAVLSGDLLTLFLFWELTAISSVFLVWRGGPSAYAAGLRYLGWHVLSGVLLLAGAIIYARHSGSFMFDEIGLGVPGGMIMMLGIGIKAGFPLLHSWIQDAYPKSSVTGTVVLATFSTKMAIYALARGYAGTEVLIYIGVIMALFPLFFASVENDLRKVFAYIISNQLGFMVCGVGVGSAMALNGVAGQVALGILFKALMFMSLGAVLHRAGTAKASALGGLFKSMPVTMIFTLVAAASIAAVPLFGAFVTKGMILYAVIADSHYIVAVLLLLASAGVIESSAARIPYVTFMGDDKGLRTKEAPWNMLLAMGVTSIFCIVLALPGAGYAMLYALLPDPDAAAKYMPYTVNHVLVQLQLVLAGVFVFALLRRKVFGPAAAKRSLYPEARPGETLDSDWLYRRIGLDTLKWLNAMMARLEAYTQRFMRWLGGRIGRRMFAVFSPAGTFSESAPSGIASVLTAAILAIALLLVYFVR